tara:strand:- start:121 stop:1185 length:1065 start_codon:yes stop_codon:yes gene_type:complete
MALSKIDLANMVENQMPQSLIADNINFRNIIINGDMSLSQRSTSVSSITGSGYNTVDRYTLQLSSQGTWTQSQSTDVPTGQGFAKSLKMDCTTADASPSASDEFSLRQKIEGQNLQYLKKGTSSAESTTVSFWVKSNKIGTYICELRDSDNSRQINKSYTISSANTWEKKTITYDGDTTGALDNDNARSLDVVWWLGAGSNFTSGTLQTSWGSIVAANRAVGQVNLADSTSNEWYVTGIQLEAGSVASDFEFLPVDVNLQRCQRYFETGIVGAAGGLSNGSGYTGSMVSYSTTKRAAATLTQSSQSYASVYSNTIVLGQTGSTNVNDVNGFYHRAINGGAATNYKFTYTADAEL